MSDALLVRHDGKGTARLITRTTPLLVIFLGLLFAYLDDDLRQMLSKNHVREPTTTGGLLFLGALVAAPIFDMVLNAATTRRGKTALIIDQHGVSGRLFYCMRRVAWHDVEDVIVEKDMLYIKPRAHGLRRLIAQLPTRFGAYNAMNSIAVSLASVDKTATDIMVAIRAKVDTKVTAK